MFPVTRVYSDKNGDTRFEEISIALTDAGEIGKLSEAFPASSIIFREVEPAYDYNFHSAPRKQYPIKELLAGQFQLISTELLELYRIERLQL